MSEAQPAGPAPTPVPEVHPVWEELEADGPQVGIVIPSEADREQIEAACNELLERAITFEVRVLSAHRNPREVAEYASTAMLRGVRVVIAAAGGAAALPGVIASYTELPVIGVPIERGNLGGMDALMSVVQMPDGVPVACMAINGARNAAIYAAKILAQGGAAPPHGRWTATEVRWSTRAARRWTVGQLDATIVLVQPAHAPATRPLRITSASPTSRVRGGSTRRWAGTATPTPSWASCSSSARVRCWRCGAVTSWPPTAASSTAAAGAGARPRRTCAPRSRWTR